jgi:D-arabinonate dehydratase
LKKPLYKLLGGYRNKVPCYVTGGYYQEGKGNKELVDEVEGYVNQGLKAIKLKIGKLSIKEDVERVEAVREAIGPDMKLAVDANNTYTLREAIKAGRAFEKYDIWWFEEPVLSDDVRSNAIVARALDIPIASGEIEYTKYGFRNLIENEAVDIIQPDVTIVGGVTEWMKIAHMASAWNTPVAPHWAQEISMHLVAAVPNALTVEFFPRKPSYRLEDKIYKTFIEPRKGFLEISNKPGLGIELDEEAVNRFRIRGKEK